MAAGLVLASPELAFGQSSAAGGVVAGDMRGEAGDGFGRVILTFPAQVIASAAVAGGVLILTFDRPVTLPVDVLQTRLGSYVSAARLDPDQMALRLALVQSVKADVKHAAEQIYLDLLPARWSGPPPPLPADVVARMAERLRAQAMPGISGQELRTIAPVRAAIARAPGRVRLTFPLPSGVGASGMRDGQRFSIGLTKGGIFDEPAVKAALAGSFGAVTIEGGRLGFDLEKGTRVQSGLEEGTFFVDVAAEADSFARPLASIAPEPETKPVEAAPRVEIARNVPAEPAAIEVQLLAGKKLSLRLSPLVPAAVFERDGLVHIVMAKTRSAKVPKLGPEAHELLSDLAAQQNDGWSLITFRPKTPGLLSVTSDAGGWVVSLSSEPTSAAAVLAPKRVADASGRSGLDIAMPDPAEPIWLENPESAERIAVVAMLGPPHAMASTLRFVEFTLPQTALGLVLAARADDMQVRSGLDHVLIRRESGLTLSPDSRPVHSSDGPAVVFDPAHWAADRRGDVRESGRRLFDAAADASRREKSPARQRLAAHYLANGLARDAAAILAVNSGDDASTHRDRAQSLMMALAQLMQGPSAEAIALLAQPSLAIDPEAQILRAWNDAMTGRIGPALETFRAQSDALQRMPEALQGSILPAAIEAALQGKDSFLAAQLVTSLEMIEPDLRESGLIAYFRGRIAALSARKDEAFAHFATAASRGSRPIEAKARLQAALLGQSTGRLSPEAARVELETVGMIWRRDAVEVQVRAQLAALAAAEGRWRDAFLALHRAVEIQPDNPVTRTLQDEMGRKFEALFLGHEAARLDQVQALAIFDEFKSLIPPGAKGDAIASRLADRLIDLDLLPQAVELMDYQVTQRLRGAPRAETAARLALLHLIEGHAQDALSTLRSTRMAGLAPAVQKARLHLEARALGELSRIDLAIELLGADRSQEAERLRGDLFWRGKRWAEAAEAYERAHGSRWQDENALDDRERQELLRAGIAYVLAGDRIGTDRLRVKFMQKMADSADGEVFRLVTVDHLSRPEAFQTAARLAVSAGSLGELLKAYRQRFPGSG